MKIIYLSMCVFCLFSSAFADTTVSIDDPKARKVYGVITKIEQVQSVNTATNNAKEFMGSFFGVLGDIFTEVVYNKSGYPIYTVKVNETIHLNVGSSSTFKEGECVVVWYPNIMGDQPDLSRIDDAGIAKSKNCSSSDSESVPDPTFARTTP
jgi:hypothetical protein